MANPDVVRPRDRHRCAPPLYGADTWADFTLRASETDLWRCPECDAWWGIRWLWWRAGAPCTWEPLVHQQWVLRKRLRAIKRAEPGRST